MRLNFDYSYFTRSDIRTGTTVIPNNEGQETRTHVIGAASTFGLTNKLSAALSVPLLINRSINQMMNVDDTQTKAGDLTAQLRYFRSLRLTGKPLIFQLAAGATIPLGDGVRNVENDSRNLTSGTVDPIFNAVGVLAFHPGWNLVGGFFTRQILTESSDGFKAGDSYRYQFGVTFAPVGGSFDLNTQVRFFTRGQDIANGVPFDNSGGDWWYLALGGSRVLFGQGETAVRLWSELEVPLHQEVSGNQLTGEWTVRGGFSFSLMIFGHADEPMDMQPVGEGI